VAYCTKCGKEQRYDQHCCMYCGEVFPVDNTQQSGLAPTDEVKLFKAETMLVTGIFLTPILPAVLTSINLKRRRLDRYWGWFLAASIIGFLALVSSYFVFSIPVIICSIINVITAIVFSNYEKKLRRESDLNVQLIQKQNQYIKASIIVIIISFVFLIGQYAYASQSPIHSNDILFGTQLNTEGEVMDLTSRIHSDDELYLNLVTKNRFKTTIFKFVIITLDGSIEEIYDSWEVDVDPGWNWLSYQIKGVEYEIDPGDYILRIFRQDQLIAEKDFYVD